MSQDKPFAPSNRKIEKALEKGQILRIRIIPGTCGLVVGLWQFSVYSQSALVGDRILLQYLSAIEDLQPARFLQFLLWELFVVSLRCIGSAALVATLVQRLLVRSKFSFALVAPNLERLQPIKGLSSLLRQMWFGVCLGLVELSCFVLLAWLLCSALCRGKVLDYALGSGPSICALVIMGAAAALLVAGSTEYWHRRRAYIKELSMTHDEVRREYRESEGEPMLKAERRALHEMISRGELIARIRRAKVVVVERDG